MAIADPDSLGGTGRDLRVGLPIELAVEPALRTVLGLAQTARPHQLTAYDAVYLDLAIRLGLSLFTRDKNLRSAASSVGVSLVKEGTGWIR